MKMNSNVTPLTASQKAEIEKLSEDQPGAYSDNSPKQHEYSFECTCDFCRNARRMKQANDRAERLPALGGNLTRSKSNERANRQFGGSTVSRDSISNGGY